MNISTPDLRREFTSVYSWLVRCNSNKPPSIDQMSVLRKLQDHGWQPDLNRKWPEPDDWGWSDHNSRWVLRADGKPPVFMWLSQPYRLEQDGLDELERYCAQYGFSYLLDNRYAFYYPGAVIGIEIHSRMRPSLVRKRGRR